MHIFFPHYCRELQIWHFIIATLIVMAHWQMLTYNAFQNVHILGEKEKLVTTCLYILVSSVISSGCKGRNVHVLVMPVFQARAPTSARALF